MTVVRFDHIPRTMIRPRLRHLQIGESAWCTKGAIKVTADGSVQICPDSHISAWGDVCLYDPQAVRLLRQETGWALYIDRYFFGFSGADETTDGNTAWRVTDIFIETHEPPEGT